jgi:hypothetical protein
MSNKTQDFRRSHITHIGDALKAAVGAGVVNPQVHVKLPSGAELRVGTGDRPAAAAVARPVAPAVVRPRARTPVAPVRPPVLSRRPAR